MTVVGHGNLRAKNTAGSARACHRQTRRVKSTDAMSKTKFVSPPYIQQNQQSDDYNNRSPKTRHYRFSGDRWAPTGIQDCCAEGPQAECDRAVFSLAPA